MYPPIEGPPFSIVPPYIGGTRHRFHPTLLPCCYQIFSEHMQPRFHQINMIPFAVTSTV